MDEYNSGMDPELKRYFRKIMNSFSVALLWLLSMATLGLFFGLGIVYEGIRWYNILFYIIFLASLGGVVFYMYKVWKKPPAPKGEG